MNIKTLVLYYIRYKQLNWYVHVRRLNEERLPRKILEWCPPGRRRKGRHGHLWIQEVMTGMRKKGINSMEWIDREDVLILTLGTERCENIDTLYINK